MALTKAELIVVPAASVDNASIDANAAIDSAKLEYTDSRTTADPRTVQDRLDETVSVQDFGAVGNGVTDDRAAILDARNASNESPVSGLFFPPGEYYLSSGISTTDKFLWGQNSWFTNGFPTSVVDATALEGSGMWMADSLSNAGTGTAGSANENTLAVQALCFPSNSLASYQKNAIYARVVTNDPSDGLTILRDAVGTEAQAIISSINTAGRAWGSHSMAIVEAGGDGLAYGHEVEVYSSGVDQPLVDQTNSKYGLHVVAGLGLSTAGIKYSASGGNFNYFLYGVKSSILGGGYPIFFDSMITVNKNGDLEIFGDATKPGGGSWLATSDVRLKRDIEDYSHGLNEILQLTPRTFKYFDTEKVYTGLVAQECESVMPEIVEQVSGKLPDGTESDDIRQIDSTALTYALVNAVKELSQKVDELQARLDSLEVK